MFKFNVSLALSLGVALIASSGCSSENDGSSDEAPTVSVDSLAPKAIVYSTDANGSWSADSKPPIGSTRSGTQAQAVFSGPPGKLRHMGVCLLVQYRDSTSQPRVCKSGADCTNYPVTIPGTTVPPTTRYCVPADGSDPNTSTSTKYCAYRGDNATWCAGTPANGYQPVAPGTYTTPLVHNGPLLHMNEVMSFSCMDACSTSDPSSSSTINDRDPVMGGNK